LDRFCIGENITVMRDILGAASKKMKRKEILESTYEGLSSAGLSAGSQSVNESPNVLDFSGELMS
jgi:hypothetical protein